MSLIEGNENYETAVSQKRNSNLKFQDPFYDLIRLTEYEHQDIYTLKRFLTVKSVRSPSGCTRRNNAK